MESKKRAESRGAFHTKRALKIKRQEVYVLVLDSHAHRSNRTHPRGAWHEQLPGKPGMDPPDSFQASLLCRIPSPGVFPRNHGPPPSLVPDTGELGILCFVTVDFHLSPILKSICSSELIRERSGGHRATAPS